jgi:hypothetical protein
MGFAEIIGDFLEANFWPVSATLLPPFRVAPEFGCHGAFLW